MKIGICQSVNQSLVGSRVSSHFPLFGSPLHVKWFKAKQLASTTWLFLNAFRGERIKVLLLKHTENSSSNPLAENWPDTICSPQRSKVDYASMNYTLSDMWHVLYSHVCKQKRSTWVAQKSPTEDAKLCSIYSSRYIQACWMTLFHFKLTENIKKQFIIHRLHNIKTATINKLINR